MSDVTRQASAPDARRDGGRVLVVGNGRRTQAALTPCSRPVEQVADIFAALGEVTISREPFSLVLVDQAAVDGDAARVAHALRRIDPAVRVVLLTDHEMPGGDAYDDCLRVPDDLPRLATLLRHDTRDAAPEHPESGAAVPESCDPTTHEPSGRPPVAAAAPAPPASFGTPRDVRPPTPPAIAPRTSSAVPAAGLTGPPAPRVNAAAPDTAAATPATTPRPPTDPRDADPRPELGDVDLVERLIHGGDSVLATALRLIVQETGWSDTRLSTDENAEPSGTPAAQAEVSYDGHRFGWLRTNLAPRESVEPWARWLARWLALERTHRDHRLMAYQDDLTGSWNRRFFNTFLAETLEQARRKRLAVTVMVFDIDDFKLYNDRFGHLAGDTVLIETVRLLTSVIRKGDRVCRMGGDEFAVIFADLEGPREAGSSHPATPELIAQRFQDQIRRMRFPKLGAEAPGNLSISAGLATFPWDGLTPQELADCADRRALQSKQRGKNAITLGPGTEGTKGLSP